MNAPRFLCPVCGRSSSHPKDVEYGYCGSCYAYTGTARIYDQSMTDEVPGWAQLWLDEDVAAWLHAEADAYFGGNVENAMNHHLRLAMTRQQYWRSLPPDPDGNAPRDPWERLQATLPPVDRRKPPGSASP